MPVPRSWRAGETRPGRFGNAPGPGQRLSLSSRLPHDGRRDPGPRHRSLQATAWVLARSVTWSILAALYGVALHRRRQADRCKRWILIRGPLGAHPRGRLRGTYQPFSQRRPRCDSTPASTPSTVASICTPGRCTSACSTRRAKSASTATCPAVRMPSSRRSRPSARTWSSALSACSAGTGWPTSVPPSRSSSCSAMPTT